MMYCKHCGQPLAPGAVECPVCHTPTNATYTAQQSTQPQGDPYGQQAYSQPQGDSYGQQAQGQTQGDPYGQQAYSQAQGDPYGQQNGSRSQPYNGWGNVYQPPYGQPTNDLQYRQMMEKADNAYILAVLGLILGIFFGPLFGWIMGGIALSNSRQAYELTGYEKAHNAMNIAKWAIGVSTVIFVLAVLIILLVTTVFSAGVLGSLY